MEEKTNNWNGIFINKELFDVWSKFNIGNIIKLKKDISYCLVDKTCLLQIDNYDLLISCFGMDIYYKYLTEAILEIRQFFVLNKILDLFSYYFINSNSFVIACNHMISLDKFTIIVEKLNNFFYCTKLNKGKIPFLLRFVMVLDKANILEIGLTELHSVENSHKNLIVCKNDDYDKKKIISELNMINVIHWAIENNGVLPYYQGIYNNVTKCICKYESLMRIIDRYGEVYLPSSFIHIAKKYHLYNRLSDIMLKRVIEDTADKKIEVSINISAFDVNYDNFINKILQALRKRRINAQYTFEILENDALYNDNIFQKFLEELKFQKFKIAIDDFGAGYSNFSMFSKVVPDYIKIDGNLIRRINESTNIKSIVETIVFLSKRINSLTIAEFVDCKQVQETIEMLGIDFSQGFYFSKPLPIDCINFEE